MDFPRKHNSCCFLLVGLPVLSFPALALPAPEHPVPLQHFHQLIVVLPKFVPAAVVLLPVILLPVLQTSALLSGPLLSSVFLQLAHLPHIPALLYQSLKRSAMLHCIFSTSSSLYTPLLLLICCHVSLKYCMASL